jgi:flavodoxin
MPERRYDEEMSTLADRTLSRRDVLRYGACAGVGALLGACAPTTEQPLPGEGKGDSRMNIGIIVYSQTGHTLLVATRLKDRLSDAGHGVTLERVETAGKASPNDTSVALRTTPATDGYDALVFGSPVWGGRPAPPTVAYLEQIPSLEDRLVAILVTGAFPPSVGRNQTIAALTELTESKGANVIGSGSVGWLSLNRKQQIRETVDSLSVLL